MAVCFANELLKYWKAFAAIRHGGCSAFSVSHGLIGSGFFLGVANSRVHPASAGSRVRYTA